MKVTHKQHILEKDIGDAGGVHWEKGSYVVAGHFYDKDPPTKPRARTTVDAQHSKSTLQSGRGGLFYLDTSNLRCQCAHLVGDTQFELTCVAKKSIKEKVPGRG